MLVLSRRLGERILLPDLGIAIEVVGLRSGAVRDLPTPFDPDLIARLDPDLVARLGRQGFRVTGYRLELVGYFEGAPAPADE